VYAVLTNHWFSSTCCLALRSMKEPHQKIDDVGSLAVIWREVAQSQHRSSSFLPLSSGKYESLYYA
jgi:hypothetical protein